ncbi:hypothetical protein [Allosphingosinicella sp.]|jgi:hypothetical protein|uniref:hypothetical protein n=1 Tax=Allosphingosinicella sp. TaxID=2823234 RepID=UPI002F1058D7
MRYLPAAAALLLATLATPASATQGQLCRPVSGSGPSINVVIGGAVSSVVAGVHLTEAGLSRSSFGQNAPVTIAQAWIDRDRLWIDVGDSNSMRYEAKLRVAWIGRGRARHLAGTLLRNGRLYRVRCEES